MVDEELRALERRAREGDPEAEAARLRLAARTGDPLVLDAVDAQLVASGKPLVARDAVSLDATLKRIVARIARPAGVKDVASETGTALKVVRQAVRQAFNTTAVRHFRYSPALCYAAQPRSTRRGWVALVRVDNHGPDQYHHKEHKFWDFGPEWTRTDQVVIGLARLVNADEELPAHFLAWPSLAPSRDPRGRPVAARRSDGREAPRDPDPAEFGKWTLTAALDRVRVEPRAVAGEWSGMAGPALERLARR